MRYLVQFEASLDGGRGAEQRGTVAPTIGRLVELTRPECFYITPTRRAGWFVAEVEDAARLGEIMVLLTEGLGCDYPTFTAVVPASEFGDVAERMRRLIDPPR